MCAHTKFDQLEILYATQESFGALIIRYTVIAMIARVVQCEAQAHEMTFPKALKFPDRVGL